MLVTGCCINTHLRNCEYLDGISTERHDRDVIILVSPIGVPSNIGQQITTKVSSI